MGYTSQKLFSAIELPPAVTQYSLRRKFSQKSLIRFGNAIIIDRASTLTRAYLIGIRYGIVPLIIQRKKFRFNRLE